MFSIAVEDSEVQYKGYMAVAKVAATVWKQPAACTVLH